MKLTYRMLIRSVDTFIMGDGELIPEVYTQCLKSGVFPFQNFRRIDFDERN
jgi:hypothetical protein